MVKNLKKFPTTIHSWKKEIWTLELLQVHTHTHTHTHTHMKKEIRQNKKRTCIYFQSIKIYYSFKTWRLDSFQKKSLQRFKNLHIKTKLREMQQKQINHWTAKNSSYSCYVVPYILYHHIETSMWSRESNVYKK